MANDRIKTARDEAIELLSAIRPMPDPVHERDHLINATLRLLGATTQPTSPAEPPDERSQPLPRTSPEESVSPSSVRAPELLIGNEPSKTIDRLPMGLEGLHATKLQPSVLWSASRKGPETAEQSGSSQNDHSGTSASPKSPTQQPDDFTNGEPAIDESDDSPSAEPDADLHTLGDPSSSRPASDDEAFDENSAEAHSDDGTDDSESFLTADEVRDLGDPRTFSSPSVALSHPETITPDVAETELSSGTGSTVTTASTSSDAKTLPPWPILTVEVREAEGLVNSEMEAFGQKLEDLAAAIAQKKVDDHEYREFAQQRALYWDR